MEHSRCHGGRRSIPACACKYHVCLLQARAVGQGDSPLVGMAFVEISLLRSVVPIRNSTCLPSRLDPVSSAIHTRAACPTHLALAFVTRTLKHTGTMTSEV